MRLHFVGIGGIGMSGIAEVLLNQGHTVSGSDVAESEATRRLASLGIKITIGHRAESVAGADVVVLSSAIRASNPEAVEAKKLRITLIPRAEMLGELMRGKTGIAVAGTHGKTTTTSMLATILVSAEMDPTIVIGGRVDSLGGNAKLGQSKYVVAEADESDGSFLHLPATYAVITNIDNDHLDHFGSMDAVDEAFVGFVGKIPFYGLAAVCGDDLGVKRCLSRFTKPVATYGFSADGDYQIQNLRCQGLESRFAIFDRKQDRALGEIELGVPGRHNALNALAAIVIALKLEIPFEKIAQGMKRFFGVRRRFDIRWKNEEKRQAIIDDYGHHPTEISATLAAVRAYWPGRILTVFQPHRYTRTLHCKEGFLSAFRDTDLLLMTDIYAAGEDPIQDVDAERLCNEIRKSSGKKPEIHYVGNLENTEKAVLERFTPGDLVLCLGAGSITLLPDRLAQRV